MKQITLTVRKLTSLLDATRGLIGQKNPEPILFQTRFGIHTFGMRSPIDVIILDTNRTVVSLKDFLKPNRIFLWNPRYDTVVECPAGTIQKKRVERGDTITLQYT